MSDINGMEFFKADNIEYEKRFEKLLHRLSYKYAELEKFRVSINRCKREVEGIKKTAEALLEDYVKISEKEAELFEEVTALRCENKSLKESKGKS